MRAEATWGSVRRCLKTGNHCQTQRPMYELKQRCPVVHHDVGCVEEQEPIAQVRELLLLLGPQRSAAASLLVARMRSVYGGA